MAADWRKTKSNERQKAGKIEKGKKYSKCGGGGEWQKGNDRQENWKNWRGRGRVKAAIGKNLCSVCVNLGNATSRLSFDVGLRLQTNQLFICWGRSARVWVIGLTDI